MTRTRISYTIPPPSVNEPIQRLGLPPLHAARNGRSQPLLVPFSPGEYDRDKEKNGRKRRTDEPHRHRLGIQSLALDTSTPLPSRGGPEGILWTGGRDGLIIAHDIGIVQSERRWKYGFGPGPGEGRKSKGVWEVLTGWEDRDDDYSNYKEDGNESEENEDAYGVVGGDGDVLGDYVPVNGVGSGRNKVRKWDGVIPFEERWEVDTTNTKVRPPPPP